MNDKRFQTFMRAIDDKYLEEAQQDLHSSRQTRISRYGLRFATLAAAVCLCLLTVSILRGIHPAGTVTAAALAELGYEMQVPGTAKAVKYDLIKLNGHEAAQATFQISGTKYVYQELKADSPQKIGADASSEYLPLTWNAGGISLEYTQADTEASVSWYTPSNQTTWCLRTAEESDALLTTAREILLATGLDIAVAPADASDISYHVFAMEDLIVAETVFSAGGNTYSFRMASTGIISEDFADISGMDGEFANTDTAQINWCSAKLAYTPGADGKIIWFDLVPGILYSVSMEENATAQELLRMANELFVPAQGDS